MGKDKKLIKKDILDKFRALPDDSDLLPPHWLESDYFGSLDFRERKLFPSAIRELVSSGLVETVCAGSQQNLRLTDKGAKLIY